MNNINFVLAITKPMFSITRVPSVWT